MTHPRIGASLLALALCLTPLAGCSSSSDDSSGTAPAPLPTETAELTLAVTDAATDEIDTFEVDIVSFRFQRADGATVEVLPQRTRVDFAELVSVSEVIAAATLPVGTYTGAFMTLDYGSASVRITGNAGAAVLKDSNGAPLSGQQEVQILFPNGGFVAGARRGYFAEVDFDLDQSLVVDAPANSVEVDSVFYAAINPAQPKETRVPGLASDNGSSDSFDLDVRLGLGLVSRGNLTVNVSSTTVFDLGGSSETGTTGLSSFLALGSNTICAVAGTVDPLRRTVAAVRVVVLPQNLDEVGGIVVARSGGRDGDCTLTLRGVSVSRALGAVTFNDTVTINCSFANTAVSRRGAAAGSLDTNAINVGQRILAYGSLSGGTLDLTSAGNGFVRLVETDIKGEVTAVGGGTLTLDVSRIGRRVADLAFDFDVAGVSQADPDALVVDTAGLPLGGIQAGSAVVIRGFFPEIEDSAGATDYDADAVIDRTNAASLLRLWWLFGIADPLTPAQGGGLTADVSQALFKQVDVGLVAPVTLGQEATLKGDGSPGLYAVRQGRAITLFTDYTSFENYLEGELGAGALLIHLRGVGRWDGTGQALSARRAFAVIR